jgi:hypothetical protein
MSTTSTWSPCDKRCDKAKPVMATSIGLSDSRRNMMEFFKQFSPTPALLYAPCYA